MEKYKPAEEYDLIRAAKKLFVSAFVVFSFAAYAVHERLSPEMGVSAVAPQMSPTAQVAAVLPPPPTDPQLVVPSQPTFPPSVPQPNTVPAGTVPQPTATSRPLPSPTFPSQQARGQYRDGTYTGRPVDAFFGLVQVQATVKNGQLADVRFLQYPNDRRTSVRINNVAIPRLQSEAIKVQSANVNIITGATLTSEGFIESLQSALSTAKS